jgi:hypothetical protein
MSARRRVSVMKGLISLRTVFNDPKKGNIKSTKSMNGREVTDVPSTSNDLDTLCF